MNSRDTYQKDLRELSKVCQDEVCCALGVRCWIFIYYTNTSYKYWSHFFKGAKFRETHIKMIEARWVQTQSWHMKHA